MTDEDDDLPVLTHILRTADGRAASSAGAYGPVGHEGFDFDVRPFEDAQTASAIVIGHELPEPPHAADAAASATTSIAAPTTAVPAPLVEPVIVADPRQDMRHDAFNLAQDTDEAASAPAIDEPLLVMPHDGPEPTSPDIDTTLDFSMPTIATRVREAVLEGLAMRIDTELDARIAQAIHAEVETALGRLQHTLRAQLGEALRDVVARAVDEEIARLGRDPHDLY